jgi:hypothetical protein
MAAVVKVLVAQDAVKGMVDRCIFEMARNKAFPNPPPTPPLAENAQTVVYFNQLHVEFLYRKSQTITPTMTDKFDLSTRDNGIDNKDEIKMIFGGFQVELNGPGNSSYSWKESDFVLQGLDRSFFHSEDFSFISTKSSFAPALMNVTAKRIVMCLLAGVNLDNLINLLLEQYGAWKLCMLPPSTPPSSSNSNYPWDTTPKNEPFKVDFTCEEMSIWIDAKTSADCDTAINDDSNDAVGGIRIGTAEAEFRAPLDAKEQILVIPNFMSIVYSKLTIQLDSSASNEEAFERIHSFDVSIS